MRKERVALSSASVQPKSSSTSTTQYKVKTKGGNLHVRSGPSTSYSIIGKMPNGTSFNVTEVKNGWGKHNFNGKMGWSCLSYAEKIKSSSSTSSSTQASNSASNSSKYQDISDLTGTIDLREPITTIKAKTGITLKGLGNKLSGVYFVEKVVHKFTNNGYSQSISVSREWKGETMKNKTSPTTSKPSTTPTTTTSTKPTVQPPKQTKTHTVKKGDTLWAISKKYYGKGSDYPKIFNANKDKLKDPNKIYPGQVLTIP